MMNAPATTAEIRRELQLMLSEERDLVYQVEQATASAEYQKLRGLADVLTKLTERRALLRASLVESKARDDSNREPARGKAVDQAAETWRQLR